MAVNPRAIPLADLRELRLPLLRTALIRIGLALVLLAPLAGAFWIVKDDDQVAGSALIPGGQGGVIVLDLSASIGSTPHLRTANALRYVQQTRQSFGLVLFSDSAYEAVPPGTAHTEMKPFMRYFGNVRLYPCIRRGTRPCPAGTYQVPDDTSWEEYNRLVEAATRGGSRVNPWAGSFRSGTRISRGLETARGILARDGMSGLGVLLISDLDDSLFDVPQLTQTLIRYRKDDIPLRVVGLRPAQDDRELFRRLLGDEAFVTRPELQRKREALARERKRGGSSDFPWALFGASGLILVLLAANEHLCGRLTWRRLARGEETTA
jgi:hypothetical protein